jgi:hypothetical protein
MLAARARGLGTVWTNLHLEYEQEVAQVLGIPFERVMQVAVIPVAHTMGTDFKSGRRISTYERIHWDGWSGPHPLGQSDLASSSQAPSSARVCFAGPRQMVESAVCFSLSAELRFLGSSGSVGSPPICLRASRCWVCHRRSSLSVLSRAPAPSRAASSRFTLSSAAGSRRYCALRYLRRGQW